MWSPWPCPMNRSVLILVDFSIWLGCCIFLLLLLFFLAKFIRVTSKNSWERGLHSFLGLFPLAFSRVLHKILVFFNRFLWAHILLNWSFRDCWFYNSRVAWSCTLERLVECIIQPLNLRFYSDSQTSITRLLSFRTIDREDHVPYVRQSLDNVLNLPWMHQLYEQETA